MSLPRTLVLNIAGLNPIVLENYNENDAAVHALRALATGRTVVEELSLPRSNEVIEAALVLHGANIKERNEPQSDELDELIVRHAWKDLAKMGFSYRITSAFKSNGIQYVHDLISKSETDVSRFDGLGYKSIREINEYLAKVGLALGMGREVERLKQRIDDSRPSTVT